MSSWFGSSSSLATAFSIAFTEPAANATFKPGDNIVLRWKNTNLPTENPPTAKIDIYESAWGTDPVVTNVDPAADLSYEALGYTVPTEGVTFKKGAKYYFHMTAGTVKAASNNFFIEPLGAPPSVTVTSPQLPQTAIPNFTKIPVTWVAKDMPAGAVAKVEIFGAAWGTDSVAATVVEATDAAAGTADWVPATDLAAGTYYAVVTVTDSAGTEIAKHTGQQFELTLEAPKAVDPDANVDPNAPAGAAPAAEPTRTEASSASQAPEPTPAPAPQPVAASAAAAAPAAPVPAPAPAAATKPAPTPAPAPSPAAAPAPAQVASKPAAAPAPAPAASKPAAAPSSSASPAPAPAASRPAPASAQPAAAPAAPVAAAAAASALAEPAAGAADKPLGASSTQMSEIPLHEGLPADETKLVDIRKFKQLAKAYIPPSRAFQHELRDFNGKWNKTFDNETEEKLKMEGRETTRAKALVDMIFAKSVTVEVTQSNLTFRQGGGGGICGCFAPKKPPISVPVGKGEAELVDLGENRQLYFDVVIDPANNLHLYAANPNGQNHAALYYQMLSKDIIELSLEQEAKNLFLKVQYTRAT